MANDPALVFPDANVLARPVTRTLLLVGADPSGLAVTWSAHVEAEADRHVRGSALPVSGLRKRLDRVLGPTGRGLADPASLADDVLEASLHVLRERLREA